MKKKNTFNKPMLAILSSEFKHAPWYHFSVDDVFDSLIEITLKNIPLFEHPFFSLMKSIHDQYDAQIDLELFWSKEIENKIYTLEHVRDLKDEIAASGDWLRFGPHAESYMVAPFEQEPSEQEVVFNKIYNEIDRIAGKNLYAEWIRLHYYSESYELSEYFKSKGVSALFSTDREAGSHRMPKAISEQLLLEGSAIYEGMNFIRTQYRVEVFTNQRVTESEIKKLFLESIEKYGYVIFYSHEYEFTRSEVRNMFRLMFKVLDSLSVKSIQHSTTKHI